MTSSRSAATREGFAAPPANSYPTPNKALLAVNLKRADDAAVTLAAIGLYSLFMLVVSERGTLGEQARILELTHDTVIIRDANDVIVYWNDGAEQLYGYSATLLSSFIQCVSIVPSSTL